MAKIPDRKEFILIDDLNNRVEYNEEDVIKYVRVCRKSEENSYHNMLISHLIHWRNKKDRKQKVIMFKRNLLQRIQNISERQHQIREPDSIILIS